MTAHLFAVDVGTLSARVGLFDARGNLIATRSAGFTRMHPAEHHAVYRMDEIWSAVCRASREVLALGSAQQRLIDALLTLASGEQGVERREPLDLAEVVRRALSERPPGSLREDTRLGILGGTLNAMLYSIHRVSEAFQVKLPMDRLLLINTVGELLDLIEQSGGTASDAG